MRACIPLVVVLAAGCRSASPGPEDDVVDNLPVYALAFEVLEGTVQAGQPATVELSVVDEEGVAARNVDYTLGSDLETAVSWGLTTVVPRTAGDHTLTLTATVGEQELTATDVLTVTAGGISDLDLVLSDYQVVVGDELTYEVFASDAFGNPVDATAAVVFATAGEVDIVGGRISSELPGDYLVVSTYDDATDVEAFIAVTGPPVGIDLTLSTMDLQVRETNSATVEVWDAYGNESAAPWSLEAPGDGLTTISGRNITYWDEGWYSVIATVDGTSLSDEEGPFLIDSTGPEIVLTTPDRGHWEMDPDVTFSGTTSDAWSGVDLLTIEGTEVTVASDGSFSHDVPVGFGINVIETAAVDGYGNTATDTRATLAGDFLDYGAGSDDGLVVRLNEGPGGLQAIEDLASGLIVDADLGGLIPTGPVFSDSSQSCLPWWLGGGCVTWYSIDLFVSNPTFGTTDVSFDPRASGQLFTRFDVNDVSVDWNASGTLVGAGASGSGDITANTIRIDMLLRPYIASNRIEVDVDSATATTIGFNWNMSGFLGDVLDVFGVRSLISGLIEGMLEDALEDAVYTYIPPVLEDALNDLLTSFTMTLAGNDYDVSLLPSSLVVDDDGLTLGLQTSVMADAWNHVGDMGFGPLYGAYGQPASYPLNRGASVGLSIDFLNQLFYALWGGGLLDMEMSSADMGLAASDLELFLPGVTDVTIAVDPLLPPVIVPGTGAASTDLQLGDLRLTLLDGDAATGTTLIDVYVSGTSEFDVGTAAGGTALTATLGDMDLYYDVVFPDAATLAASDTEAFLGALVPLLLPSLTDSLGEIAIPSISGFEISGATITPDGPEDGILRMTGDLTPE